MNIIEKLESRVARLEAMLQISETPEKKPLPITESKSKHKELIMAVLADNVPKSVSVITKQAALIAHKKQHKPSINVMCSMLTRAGILKRLDKGVYQKAS